MNYLDSLDQIEKNSNIYIYGSGSFAITLSDQIDYHRRDIKISGFIDKFKSGGHLRSKPILNINRLPEISKEEKIIIATDSSFWNEISVDLKENNYFFNRFHDFNIYRRKEATYDVNRIKKYFTQTDQVKIMFEAIENKNIKYLIDNLDVINSYDEYLEKLNLKLSHTIINGGGSNGNENEFFQEKVGKKGKIYSFDPNHIETSNSQVLEISPYVLYDKNIKIGFDFNGSRSRIIEDYKDDDNLVNAITIDNFIHKKHIKKINCITLDVEGFEKKVLEGAKSCIKQHKPNLAISVYHSTADFFEIPALLKEICNDYKFDIGIYSQQGMDTMLHASVA